MKKWIAALLCLLLLVGCGESAPVEEDRSDTQIRMTQEEKAEGWRIYPESGVKYFARKDLWREMRGYLYKYNGNSSTREEEPIYSELTLHFITPEQNEAINDVYTQNLPPSEENELLRPIFKELKPLFGIFVFRKDLLEDPKDLESITGFPEQEVLFDEDNLLTVWCTAPEDASGLDEDMAELYKEFYEDVGKIRESMIIEKPLSLGQILDQMDLAKMTSVDLEGNEVVLGDVFKENKMTMVNVWATFCGPCKMEMPHIAAIEKDLREEGFGVLGVVGDTNGETDDFVEDARQILQDAGAEFLNVKRSEDMNRIIERMTGFPTTFFVDKEGRILGKAHLGGRSEEEFRDLIKEYMPKE